MHWPLRRRKPLQLPSDSLQSLLSALKSRLQTADVADSNLEASIILEHVTGLDRTSLLRDIRRPVSASELNAAAGLLQRRLEGEPVQYVVGKGWFYGREFYVDSRVLIPRPETELLIGLSLDRGLRSLPGSPELKVVDVGTGSGVLAITAALENPGAQVVATDLSLDALRVARCNCVLHGVAGRVELVATDGLTGISDRFNLILANPPYVPTDEIARLQREVRDFEPRLALDGGDDGLGIVRRLLPQCTDLLVAGGWLLIELACGQALSVSALLTESGTWSEVSVVQDLVGVDRVVCARRAAR
jgi:release factor glutamine methyltransferase